MKVSISNVGQGFKFEVKRMLEMDEHELLSIMAREMIARGDYASAEPIIDYLIYARLWTKPWGGFITFPPGSNTIRVTFPTRFE